MRDACRRRGGGEGEERRSRGGRRKRRKGGGNEASQDCATSLIVRSKALLQLPARMRAKTNLDSVWLESMYITCI
jgi:hypothetical protein